MKGEYVMKLFLTAAITSFIMLCMGYLIEGPGLFTKFPNWFTLLATIVFLMIRTIAYNEFTGFRKNEITIYKRHWYILCLFLHCKIINNQ